MGEETNKKEKYLLSEIVAELEALTDDDFKMAGLRNPKSFSSYSEFMRYFFVECIPESDDMLAFKGFFNFGISRFIKYKVQTSKINKEIKELNKEQTK